MRKLGEPRPTPSVVQGLDGVARTPAEEVELNQIVHHTFATPVGQRCLAYLRSITTEVVMPASQPDHVLRYLEGMRCVVKMIDDRCKAQERK